MLLAKNVIAKKVCSVIRTAHFCTLHVIDVEPNYEPCYCTVSTVYNLQNRDTVYFHGKQLKKAAKVNNRWCAARLEPVLYLSDVPLFLVDGRRGRLAGTGYTTGGG